jgi:hypothetical protein
VQLAERFTGCLGDDMIQTAPPAQDTEGQLPEQDLIRAGEMGMSFQSFGNEIIQENTTRAAGGILSLPVADDLQRQVPNAGVSGRFFVGAMKTFFFTQSTILISRLGRPEPPARSVPDQLQCQNRDRGAGG